MKAFIITVLTPDDWKKVDVLSSVNIGVRHWAESQNRPIGPLDYNAMVIDELNLRKPE